MKVIIIVLIVIINMYVKVPIIIQCTYLLFY